MQSSPPTRRSHHSLGSNPWIFLNPSCANALLILFVAFVFLIDLIIISIHWDISTCSDILKLWIIGKYFAPLLSYISCCLFVPCNIDETMEVTTAIPYSQHELRQLRIRQNVLNLTNPISQIRNTQNNNLTHSNNTNHDHHHSHSRISMHTNHCMDIPYPYDVMLSEWFVSPSTITTNIAESIENHLCKTYIYLIGMIFDRGILELIWLFIGGISVIYEDASCRNHTPILYYYVLLQIILGGFITSILILWMVSSSICPLQVARLMACCYGMECDILGILPRHLFQRLLTMHNTWNNNNNNNNNYNQNENQYENSIQIAKNYHTLSTIPHHYEQNESVELTTSSTLIRHQLSDHEIIQKCGMCRHNMELLSGDTNTLECGHSFHSVCIDSWPINLECPQCSETIKQNKSIFETEDIDDSDDQLEPITCDSIQKSTLGSGFQML